MKGVRTALVLVPLFLCTILGSEQLHAAQASAEVKREIIAREKASFVAWQNKDKAFYADYWVEDMTEFIPYQPSLAHKAEIMLKFDDLVKAWRLDSFEMVNPEVHQFGDVAVLTYEENVSGAYEGKPVRYRGQATMVYVRQDGRWRGVHYHESKD
jgi:ketosteroid isomerase-like protein